MRLRLFVCASLASAILGTGFDDVNGEARNAHSELTGSANLIPRDWPEAELVSSGDSVTSESYVRGAQLSVEFEPKPPAQDGEIERRGKVRGQVGDSSSFKECIVPR